MVKFLILLIVYVGFSLLGGKKKENSMAKAMTLVKINTNFRREIL